MTKIDAFKEFRKSQNFDGTYTQHTFKKEFLSRYDKWSINGVDIALNYCIANNKCRSSDKSAPALFILVNSYLLNYTPEKLKEFNLDYYPNIKEIDIDEVFENFLTTFDNQFEVIARESDFSINSHSLVLLQRLIFGHSVERRAVVAKVARDVNCITTR